MRKEGTGKLQNPDTGTNAGVRKGESHLGKASESGACFRESARRSPARESRRESLPGGAWKGVAKRDAGARLRIASDAVDGDPGFLISSDRERANTGPGYPERKVGEQESAEYAGREEKK